MFIIYIYPVSPLTSGRKGSERNEASGAARRRCKPILAIG